MEYKKITDFIKDLFLAEKVPLAVPVFMGNEKKYLNECIDSTFVSSVGQFVDRFENDIKEYTGCKRAVVCVSGTNALHMSLMQQVWSATMRSSPRPSPLSPPAMP